MKSNGDKKKQKVDGHYEPKRSKAEIRRAKTTAEGENFNSKDMSTCS